MEQEIETPNSNENDQSIIFDRLGRRIDIFRRVDRTTTLELVSLFDELKLGTNKDLDELITVIVNTPGGEAWQGLAIYDLMRSSNLNIRTVVLGEVASSGLAIVLGGKSRFMHSHASLLFHRTGFEFDKPQKVLEQKRVEIQSKQLRTIDKYYAQIITSNSNISLRKLRIMEDNEECLTAERAKELGLIHEIIT